MIYGFSIERNDSPGRAPTIPLGPRRSIKEMNKSITSLSILLALATLTSVSSYAQLALVTHQQAPIPNGITGNEHAVAVEAGGGVTEQGGAGRIGTALSEGSTRATLAVIMGSPALRIQTHVQTYIIPVRQTLVGDAGNAGGALFFVSWVPITIEGAITLNNLQAQIGNSHVTAGPEVFANLGFITAIGSGVGIIGTLSAGVGATAGVAHDADGTGTIAGPTGRFNAQVTFAFSGGHAIDVGGQAHGIINVIDNSGANAGAGGYVGYRYINRQGGPGFYVRGLAEVEQNDAHSASGVNNDSGTSNFFGGTVGINF